MNGDAYRALCAYADKHGYRVKLQTVMGPDRRSEIARLAVWKDGAEVAAAAVIGDPDHAAESLLRWLAYEDAAA